MYLFALICGLFLVAAALMDAYQTIILPRRPVGNVRITWLFFLVTWTPWRKIGDITRDRKKREQWYSTYGPVSLLMLIGLWAGMLALGFALIFFGLHAPVTGVLKTDTGFAQFRSCLYLSGTTLFTLGIGDVLPTSHLARVLIVAESGTGLGFFALVIGYVPVLYNTFSHREVTVALLDSRAGSPPTATELIVRHNFNGGHHALTTVLAEWERWAAEMLETHISYPILCYYRSQHDNQSWLSAATAVLDTCALLITAIEGPSTRQAQLTFAMARHMLVDLGHVFNREEVEKGIREAPPVRLKDEEFARMCDVLAETGFVLCADLRVRERLDAIRKLYEPHACAMAQYLRLDLPVWVAPPRDPNRKPDAWATVAGMRSPAALAERLSTHISAQAASSRLHDDSHL
ncbi:MAG TPA: potassium channel family protein [Acidobacteriaceae bacterium]|jgi:hypothetical protein